MHWSDSVRAPYDSLPHENEWNAKKEKERENLRKWQAHQREKKHLSHFIACQSAKVRRTAYFALTTECGQRALRLELNLCSLELRSTE